MSQMPIAEFADKLNEILPIITREFIKQTTDFHKLKMTLPQIVILDFLSRHGESKMTDIANFMNVTTAAITGIVDRLVRDHYAIRLSDPNDRRIIRVKLTKRGVEIVRGIVEKRRRVIINTFGKISQKERENYLDILMHIKDHLTT